MLKEKPKRWANSLSNKWYRLSLCDDNNIEYTDTIEFIHFNEVPKDKKITYAHFVYNYRPLKDERWKVRLVVGRDKLEFQAETGSPTANTVETKNLL